MLEQDAQPIETPTTPATVEAAPEQKPEGQEGEEHKPKTNGFQKRIDKLTREKYELQGRLKAMETYAPRQSEPQQEAEESDDPDVKIRREVDRRVRESLQQQEARRHGENVSKEWKQQESEAKKRYEDYDDVVPDFVESWNPPRHVEAAILECDKKVEVTYYLAKHPEEADAIAAMSPFRAAASIGKIEARLEAQPTLKRQSAAPEPIAPVKAKGKADDGLGDDLSTDDWLKRRNAQIKKNR